jgi:hypothetical protein
VHPQHPAVAGCAVSLDRRGDARHAPVIGTRHDMHPTRPTPPTCATPAAGATLRAVDELLCAADADDLAAWISTGEQLAATPVRCAAGEGEPAARGRLDLALRMLPGQPVTHWCRAAGDAVAVVLAWPLPARGVAVYGPSGEDPELLVLAIGRAGDGVDLWRFRLDGPDRSILRRGRALLPAG